MLFSTFAPLFALPGAAAPVPLASTPCGVNEPPTPTQVDPVLLRLNSVSLFPTTAVRDPYYLDFNQITSQIPGGWAGVNQGGYDFASTFRYPDPTRAWNILSSTYDPTLPIELNLTINSVNETGKIFAFEVQIDLNHDGTNDTFIEFDTYTTVCTLEPEHVNLQGRFLAGSSFEPMDDARVYLKIWRTDSVTENPRAIARVYSGLLYDSTLTLPWISPAPVAVFAKPDNSETYWTSTPILFSAEGTRDPAANLENLSCKYTFGDNSTPRFVGCNVNATHIYRDPGCYDISLNVTNLLGFTSEVQRAICVAYKNIPPTVSAVLLQGPDPFVGNFSGFAGVPYQFTAVFDDVDNGQANVSIAWDFRDGFTSTEVNVSHSFISPGFYNITLQAFDGTDATVSVLRMNVSRNRDPVIVWDCPARINKGEVMKCSAASSFDPDGIGIVSTTWNFGDEFCTETNPCTASGQNANHRYDVRGTNNVRVWVDDGISVSTAIRTVKINEQPLAVCPPAVHTETSRNVTLDASLSSDPDNDTLLFRWKFGDGFETDYGTSPVALHVYQIPKPEGYDVQLIANDGLWTHSCSVRVFVELINEPPTARIWCAASTLWLGDTMRCSANQSSDEFELRYGWDFDASDGIACQDDFRRDITYLYSSDGQFVTTLCVTDNRGKTDETSISIVVQQNPGYCNQIFDMGPFLRKTSASPPGQTQGEFDARTSVSPDNITAVKKGCWVAYSIELKVGDKVIIDIEVKQSLQGKVVDLLTFDVQNFLLYKDKPTTTLPQNSLDTRCFQKALAGAMQCTLEGLKPGTLYIVIDNRDLPVLTPTEGPAEFSLHAIEPWPPTTFDSNLLMYLVGGAGAAIVLVGLIWFLSRRAEQSY